MPTVRWTPNSQLRLMFGAQAEMGCRVRSGFARAVDVEADVVHVGPTAGAVAPGIGPEVCHDPHLLGSAGSAHSYHFSNRARIHPSEPAWYPWRLHTLEVRMEHDRKEAFPEAVPACIWVKQGEVDTGYRPGLNTAEHDELVELRKEVKELRRANDILQAAASFFGAELDRRRTK